MTLDEAIEHAEEVASSCEGQCSLDHKQLAEWLKELKICRSHNFLIMLLRLDFLQK